VAILWQNIALALGLKGLVLVLTVLGHGSMLLAVFADMGTSMLVIGNGLRMLRR
jgi:Cd2+/Zn2+-exporting ATPase